MKRAFNRQLNSDGIDALGYWTSADDTSGTVIDDNQGNAFVHLGFGTTKCDVLDASASFAVIGNDIVVTLGAESTSPVGYNITWTGTVSGSADGDVLVPNDTVRSGPVGDSMMGIAGIISDANPPLLSGGLHGLPVATNDWWKSQVFANAGVLRPLTLALMQKPLSQISVRSDKDESDVKFLLGNVYIRDKYEQLLVVDRRHVNRMMLDGGFEGVEYSGRPFVVDPQCKRNRIYYIAPECLRIFRTSDFDWASEDGSVLKHKDGFDAYYAVLFHYGDLACVTRNGLGLLSDLQE